MLAVVAYDRMCPEGERERGREINAGFRIMKAIYSIIVTMKNSQSQSDWSDSGGEGWGPQT